MKKILIGFGIFIFLFTSSQVFAKSEQEALLFDSVRSGHEGIVVHLINKGVSIELVNTNGETPLTLAVRKENIQLVKTLLARNADIDAPDAFGETPLMWAVIKQNKKLVLLLLDAGVKMSLETQHL